MDLLAARVRGYLARGRRVNSRRPKALTGRLERQSLELPRARRQRRFDWQALHVACAVEAVAQHHTELRSTIEANEGALTDQGQRHRAGKPTSALHAEGTVSAAGRNLRLSGSRLARPCIWRLGVFSRLTCLSVWPLVGRVGDAERQHVQRAGPGMEIGRGLAHRGGGGWNCA